MGKQKADYLLRSDHIFTSTVENPFAGYVAVSGQNILAVGTDDGSDWIDEQTEVLELEDQLVTPGFIDVHTFFTGYAIFHIGIDMSGITSQEEFLQKIKEQVEKEKEPSTVFGHGWNSNGFETEGLEEKLNEAYPDRAVIVFAADRSTCMMNRKAEVTVLYLWIMERLWKTDRRKSCLNSRNMREQKVFLRKYYSKNIKHVDRKGTAYLKFR